MRKIELDSEVKYYIVKRFYDALSKFKILTTREVAITSGPCLDVFFDKVITEKRWED